MQGQFSWKKGRKYCREMIRNGVENSLRYSKQYFILDVKCFIKNCVYRAKLRFKRAKKRNVLYMVIDNRWKNPGLADRIKAMVALYNMAKYNGYTFKFYWKDPFPISDYLKPKGDFEIEKQDLEYSIFDTRIITEKNWADNSTFEKDKQYHCYLFAGNEMPKLFLNTGLKWAELFNEMFVPSDELESAYRATEAERGLYVSVHLRFVNALERFENTFFDNYIESEEERKKLIEKCKRGIMQIVEANKGKDVYVFSDSKLFLEQLKDMPVHVLGAENIKHSGNSASKDGAFKTLLDLIFMSRGEKVYRINAKELYNYSGYAPLAAAISDIPFEIYNI